jgi:hypothetical protein
MLLGFSFCIYKIKWIIIISKRSIERIRQKLKAITLRSKSMAEGERIGKLNTIIRGWVNYFVIAMAKSRMQHLDGTVRNRLRMCKWKQWKATATRRANLLKLGVSPRDAYQHGGSSAGYCRVAQSYILCKALPVAYFRKQGYVGFSDLYYRRTEKQTTLF